MRVRIKCDGTLKQSSSGGGLHVTVEGCEHELAVSKVEFVADFNGVRIPKANLEVLMPNIDVMAEADLFAVTLAGKKYKLVEMPAKAPESLQDRLPEKG